MISKNDLVGVWNLEEFIVHRENGNEFAWPGPQSGTLIYTACGHVSVAQNRNPLPDPTPEDKARVANFYTGTYALDSGQHRVVHTPLQSSVPSIVGVPAAREISFDTDGRLRLSGIGLKERVTLVWRRKPDVDHPC